MTAWASCLDRSLRSSRPTDEQVHSRLPREDAITVTGEHGSYAALAAARLGLIVSNPTDFGRVVSSNPIAAFLEVFASTASYIEPVGTISFSGIGDRFLRFIGAKDSGRR
jgi:hypothetical protein